MHWVINNVIFQFGKDLFLYLAFTVPIYLERAF